MKQIMLIGALLLAAVGASAGNSSLSDCRVTKEVGYAHVNRPGFATKIRKLRALCAKMENRYEAANIEWSQYDQAYVCIVGSHCNSD